MKTFLIVAGTILLSGYVGWVFGQALGPIGIVFSAPLGFLIGVIGSLLVEFEDLYE